MSYVEHWAIEHPVPGLVFAGVLLPIWLIEKILFAHRRRGRCRPIFSGRHYEPDLPLMTNEEIMRLMVARVAPVLQQIGAGAL